MRVLVIAAHPDDEVYGMGGTIAKLASLGAEIHVLIVTDGCTAQYAGKTDLLQMIEKKRAEALEANRLLGTAKVHFGTLPDMKLDKVPHVEVNHLIEETIDRFRPEVVYTHFYGDVNVDHQMVYRSTLVAVRPIPGQQVRELYCYQVPSSTEWSPQLPHTSFLPNMAVEITNFTNQKEQAVLAYQTEVRSYPHPRSAQYIRKMDLARGLELGIGSAEMFWQLRRIL